MRGITYEFLLQPIALLSIDDIFSKNKSEAKKRKMQLTQEALEMLEFFLVKEGGLKERALEETLYQWTDLIYDVGIPLARLSKLFCDMAEKQKKSRVQIIPIKPARESA